MSSGQEGTQILISLSDWSKSWQESRTQQSTQLSFTPFLSTMVVMVPNGFSIVRGPKGGLAIVFESYTQQRTVVFETILVSKAKKYEIEVVLSSLQQHQLIGNTAEQSRKQLTNLLQDTSYLYKHHRFQSAQQPLVNNASYTFLFIVYPLIYWLSMYFHFCSEILLCSWVQPDRSCVQRVLQPLSQQTAVPDRADGISSEPRRFLRSLPRCFHS